MRKGILAIAAAGSVFALTAAGATGYELTTPTQPDRVVQVGAASLAIDYQSRCTDAMTIAYNSTNNDGVINEVVVSDKGASDNCKALLGNLTITDSAAAKFGPTADVTPAGTTDITWTFAVTGGFDLNTKTAPVTTSISLHE